MNMNAIQKEEFLDRMELAADRLIKHTRFVLPTIARLCLVSTFIEDGIRMWYQWEDQRDYINSTWSVGWFLATLFVIFNLFGQIIPCGLILARKYVTQAIMSLFSIIVLQTFAYSILWDVKFALRSLALLGSLMLLWVDSFTEKKRTISPGLPTVEKNEMIQYVHFVGRILLVLMFLTLFQYEWTAMRVIELVVGASLITLISVGHKAQISSLALVLWLLVINFYQNPWWRYAAHRPMRDFLKYDFFQTMSVIGGLLILVIIGPGKMSIDKQKKAW
ncbi:hypothetical protein SNEBB_003908 [Seison nebaliae]|nr:hypothetical protein SNEBB_003908 [Seison nebaliae]